MINRNILIKFKKISFTIFKSPITFSKYLFTFNFIKLKSLIEVNYLEYNFRTGGIKNIAITYDCNNDCEYCKNQLTIANKNQEMSFNNFVKVLKWHQKQGMNQILLTGGEPTIHSKFKNFISESKKRNFLIKLNTNLLFTKEIEKFITNDIFFEIVAHYKTHSTQNEKSIYERNLNHLIKKRVNVRLRYNLYREDISYLQILKFGKKYKIKYIDISIPHPSSMENQKHFSTIEYIKSKKKLLLNFIKDTEKYGLKARFVVPLPLCIFSKKDIKYFQKKVEIHGVCNFVAPSVGETVIHPNLDVTWCNADFAHNLLKKGNLFNFKNNNEIMKKYKKEIEKLCWDIHLYKKCKNCEYMKKKLCHGGCLVYKFNKN
jgi:radical SAM protein with 4Fe4S-binding SPASM domain